MIKTRPSLLLDFANSRQLDPRVVFSRASSATRVNEVGAIETVLSNVPRFDYAPADEPVLGPELVANSNFGLGSSGWLARNSTIDTSGGACVITTSTLSGRVERAVTLEAGKKYVATAKVLLGSTIKSVLNVIRDAAGDYATVGVSSTANAGVMTLLSVTFVAPSGDVIVQVRNNDGVAIGDIVTDDISIREIQGYNARKGECRGLLMEPNRTNWAKWSEDINSGCTLSGTISATANTATRTGNGNSYLSQLVAPITIGNPVTFSVYAKAGLVGGRLGLRISGSYPNRADAVFDLLTGSVVGVLTNAFSEASAKISPPDRDGLMRCEITATVGGSDCVQVVFGPTDPGMSVAGWEAGSSVLSDVFVTRRQVEVSRFSTSYIPTTTSEVTRAADFAKIDNLTNWYSASEGTLFAEFVRGAVTQYPEGTNRQIVRLDGESGSSIAIVTGATNPSQNRFDVMASGVAQAQIGNAGYVERTISRTAGSYSADSFGFSQTGLPPSEDITGVVPVASVLKIGSAAGGDALGGWIRKVAYFPQRFSRTELQELVS